MANAKKSSHAKKKGQKKGHEQQKDSGRSSAAALKIGLISLLTSIFAAAIAILVKQWIAVNETTTDPEVFDGMRKLPPMEKIQPQLGFLLSRACKIAYCHESLKASNRTLRAKDKIEVGETLFEINRTMQIWDLDALRDPYVRKHLFSASHKLTGNKLGNEAFLAAYLALQIDDFQTGNIQVDPVRVAYFDTLPTLEDFDYHPLLKTDKELKSMLGPSSAYLVLDSYRNMIVSEYDAFISVSPDFASRISKSEYFAARLNVLTRAIPVGPPGPSEAMKFFSDSEFEDQDLLKDELQAYKELLGIDLLDEKKGSIALIPLADMFNHHPDNNVDFGYKVTKDGMESLIVSVDRRSVQPGFEPMVSYGTIADSHLFARYGFVNGDGSGHTQISIAHHHDVLMLNLSSQYDYLPHKGVTQKFIEFQARPLAKYLAYDDGYGDCIPGPTSHPEEAELKRLKHKHIIRIANDIDRWEMLMPPRNPFSGPAPVTNIPITTETPHFIRDFVMKNYNADKLQETCRLISLIDSDFDGKATSMLRENLHNKSFVVGPGNDDLEFRSLFCIGRWVGMQLIVMEEQGEIGAERKLLEELNQNEFGTIKWAAQHVRFGEMQGLQALGNLIVERVNSEWENDKFQTQERFNVRNEPCPEGLMNYLFDEELTKI